MGFHGETKGRHHSCNCCTAEALGLSSRPRTDRRACRSSRRELENPWIIGRGFASEKAPMHELNYGKFLAALLAFVGVAGADALGAELEAHSNTHRARSERTPSRQHRRECCRSPYHRCASNWASAGRASRLIRNDFIFSPRSAGMDPEPHLRAQPAQVSGAHVRGREAIGPTFSRA